MKSILLIGLNNLGTMIAKQLYDLGHQVLAVDRIQTRVFANRIYVDIEISADADLTLSAGHAIAEQVHHAIEEQFPAVKHIMVHVNPYGEDPDGGRKHT